MSACAVMLGCGINAGLPAHVAQAVHKLIWIRVAYRAITDPLPLLKAAGRGVIINMSSVAGRLGYAFRTPYSATKWA